MNLETEQSNSSRPHLLCCGKIDEPVPTHTRFTGLQADTLVLTNCCVRRVRADQTISGVIGQKYQDSIVRTVCSPGCGCSIDKKHLRGAQGRRYFTG